MTTDEVATVAAEALAADGPPAKKAKVDEPVPAAAPEAPASTAPADAAGAGDAAAAAPPPTPAEPADPPVTLGFKTFTAGADAAKYYYGLINALTVGQPLNEYEHVNVLALLKAGHPEAGRKVGAGVAAITVRPHAAEGSPCFHLVRPGGALEDFSTKKCIAALFPAFGAAAAARAAARPASGGGGRGRGGGRRGGRGRGGGGRGRGAARA